MAFGHFDGNSHQNNETFNEINMIPLIDVMLVLLILFIITAPFFTPHAFKVNIPEADTEILTPDKPDNITVAIDAKGQMFWSFDMRRDVAVDPQTLQKWLMQAVAQPSIPALHLLADKQTPYEFLTIVMSAAQQAGIENIAFVVKTTAAIKTPVAEN